MTRGFLFSGSSYVIVDSHSLEVNSAEKVEEYFSGLTAQQVGRLGQIYKYDFAMFGYDYQRYLRNIPP